MSISVVLSALLEDSLENVSVTSEKEDHAFHAVFFARPENYDTVSQSAKAYQNGKAMHISSPNAFA